MSPRRPHLELTPERCDGCGRCAIACDRDAIGIGRSHIYIDWTSCDSCRDCAEVCDRGAIRPKGSDVSRRGPDTGGGLARASGTDRADATSGIPAVRREGAVTTVSRRRRHTSTGSTGHPGAVEWSIGEVLAVLAVGLAMVVVKDVVLTSGGVRSLSLGGIVAVRAALQVGYYAGLLVLLVWLARRRGVDFRRAYGLRRFPLWRSAAWVVAGLFALRIFTLMYGAVTQALGWEPPLRSTSQLTDLFGPSMAGLALALATVVVIGPFVEEVVFRGMLLGALRQVTSVRTAIAGSALLFAASHLTLWTFVPLAVLGAFQGWLVSTKGSVWPPVVLHALYNAVPLAAAFYVSGSVGV